MAGPITTTEAAALLEETWNGEWRLNPTEESTVRGYVIEPESRMVGNKLHMRKVKALTASEGTATATLKRDNLTFTNNTEEEVQATPLFAYVGVQLTDIVLMRTLEDGKYRSALQKQMMAALDEKIDTDLYALAIGASQSESGPLDDPMYRRIVKKMAKGAKGKYKHGVTPANLFIHVDQLDAAMDIPALKEYQIRGSQGAATSGQLVTTFGIKTVESGLVYVSGGTAYQAFMLPDAWAIGWNRKPVATTPQTDGFDTFFLASTEYAVAELFDSSIVVAASPVTP